VADENYTVFDPQSAKRIAEAVRKLERRFQEIISRLLETPQHRTRWTAWGKLTSTLARGGAGTFKFYNLALTGGLSASPSDDTNYVIVDPGTLPADISPLPSGTVISVGWSSVAVGSAAGGVFVRIDYDCDAV
jgi:hypothetical protein